MDKRVVVIGGGICRLRRMLRLARAGREVVLLERSPNLGGLVVSFEIAGTPLECFYHHVFPNERDMLRLINEMGLGSRFEWRPSTVGVLRQDRIWPFTSAFDLLRFEPLPVHRPDEDGPRLRPAHGFRLAALRPHRRRASGCASRPATVRWRRSGTRC